MPQPCLRVQLLIWCFCMSTTFLVLFAIYVCTWNYDSFFISSVHACACTYIFLILLLQSIYLPMPQPTLVFVPTYTTINDCFCTYLYASIFCFYVCLFVNASFLFLPLKPTPFLANSRSISISICTSSIGLVISLSREKYFGVCRGWNGWIWGPNICLSWDLTRTADVDDVLLLLFGSVNDFWMKFH